MSLIIGANCKGCGTCVSECLVGAITVQNNKAYIDEVLCIGCAQCYYVCPDHVIAFKSQNTTTDEAIEEYQPTYVVEKQVALNQ